MDRKIGKIIYIYIFVYIYIYIYIYIYRHRTPLSHLRRSSNYDDVDSDVTLTSRSDDHKNDLSNKNEAIREGALTVKVQQGSTKRNFISSVNSDTNNSFLVGHHSLPSVSSLWCLQSYYCHDPIVLTDILEQKDEFAEALSISFSCSMLSCLLLHQPL